MNNVAVWSVFVALSTFGIAMPAMAQSKPSVPAGWMTPKPYTAYAPASEIASSPLYFGNADSNHDGLLSRSEVPKQLSDLVAHFDVYDFDQNHRLDSSEYAFYMQRVAKGNCRGSGYLCPVSNPYAVAKTP